VSRKEETQIDKAELFLGKEKSGALSGSICTSRGRKLSKKSPLQLTIAKEKGKVTHSGGKDTLLAERAPIGDGGGEGALLCSPLGRIFPLLEISD